ncbi:MAG: iron-containing alcohol dehydrogenase [Thermodesulfobacteriota bacterium]
MQRYIDNAQQMLKEWKKDAYIFGFDVLNNLGNLASQFGKKCLLVVADLGLAWVENIQKKVEGNLKEKGVEVETILGAQPNAPREDTYRIALHIARSHPDMVVVLGGGSTIDAVKAANVLATYAPGEVKGALEVSETLASTIDPYFGVGLVSRVQAYTQRPLRPLIAVQTAASSGAHLTKYANITDLVSAQKKLIVDEAIVPKAALFDYGVTLNTPLNLTLDGGLDGIAHAWEVFMGASGQPYYIKMKEIARACLRLIIYGLPKLRADLKDREGRLCLGLGTDLGGYAIMIGGTSGPHLGSFSLIDVLSHGRACAILNPYYTVLFAPRIQDQLSVFAEILKEREYIKARIEGKKGKALAMLVARGLIQFSKSLGFPTTLKEAGVSRTHIKKMIQAAKDPQLKMKLQNMPTPMEAEKGDVDRLMKPTLEAAYTGDLDLIPAE